MEQKGPYVKVIEKLRRWNSDAMVIHAARVHEQKIIELNYDDQLYERGEGGDGRSLRDYKKVTKNIKASKGQRYDHTTLRDSQDFHAAFFIIYRPFEFEISSKDEKTPKLIRSYGRNIFGLTQENLAFLSQKLLEPTLQDMFRKSLLG